MIGGDYAANLGGLDHYARHGYKGCKSGDPRGGWRLPPQLQSAAARNFRQEGGDLEDPPPHHDAETGWVTVPYRHNRATLHSGHLPHLSSPVDSLDPPGLYRVVLGLNIFGIDAGPEVMLAPEHSAAFRRRVKIRRAAALWEEEAARGGGGIGWEAFRRNRSLARLLVLANRHRKESGEGGGEGGRGR